MFGAELPACLTTKDCKSMLGLMGVKEEETSLPTGDIVDKININVAENSDSSSSEAESEDEVDSEYYLVRASKSRYL
ncbi:hypothetical protein J6590_089759 [Homalodisca vitripennis]|nr:hypothetical protein J6590_089759 [Homalodisca vitripennis]